MQGSIAFGIGLLMVLIGWPVLGMMVESYGFVALFRLVNHILHLYDHLKAGLCALRNHRMSGDCF